VDFPWPPWDNLLLLTKEDTVKDIQEKVSKAAGEGEGAKGSIFRIQGTGLRV
jgi:hypothetical protein